MPSTNTATAKAKAKAKAKATNRRDQQSGVQVEQIYTPVDRVARVFLRFGRVGKQNLRTLGVSQEAVIAGTLLKTCWRTLDGNK
jgi:hypothetical protein